VHWGRRRTDVSVRYSSVGGGGRKGGGGGGEYCGKYGHVLTVR